MKKILMTILFITTITLCGCSDSNEYRAENRQLGINLSGVSDYSSEYPFKDLFKMSRAWRTNSLKQDEVDFQVDENGWITDFKDNDHAIAYLATDYLPETNYVLTYEGEGDIKIEGKYLNVVNIDNGRIEFEIRDVVEGVTQNNRVTITSCNENYIKNITIFETQFEDSLDDIFNPVFINNIDIFSDIRFMDWMDTNNSTISEWSTRPKVDDSTYSICGVPLEVMIDLCNKIKANPWFCMPHAATNEYIEEFSKYVNKNLDKNLTVYIENSNETWNGTFSAHSYNKEQGLLHDNIGNIGDDWKISAHYYAQRSVEIFNIWDEHYKNDLVKVLATQSNNKGIGTTVTNYQLSDGTYAGEYADALAIAPYIGNTIQTTNQEEIFNLLNEDLSNKYINNLLDNKQTADNYNLRLICYEAGQHLEKSSDDNYTEAFIEANKSLLMGELYNEYLDIWSETISDKMFLFNSTGKPSKYGSWGLLENQYQTHTDSIKYTTVKNWINNN